MADPINGMNLDDALGQVDTDADRFTQTLGSCRFVHGASPFKGFR